MGLRINTNVGSIAAQRSVRQNNRTRLQTFGRLASGSRIVRSADDAAGLAISDNLKAQIRSSKQANRNANDGISFVQVAEGGLNEISNMLVRMRELAIQSSSDTVGDTERSFTNKEYQELKKELDRISQVTEYNGTKLISGQGNEMDFQIGIGNNDFQDRIKYNPSNIDASLDSLGLSSLSVTDKASAQEGLDLLDAAITKVAGQRSELGAMQNRLTVSSNNLETSIENLSAANSRIRDLDYAAETAESQKLAILENASTSVLAQANTANQSALRLIG